MIVYHEFDASQLNAIKALYAREKWNAYLRDDEKLKRAFDQSLYRLGAFEQDELVGLIRCVGDGEHVLLVQDLIVRPDYQKRGIGTKLFQAVWDKYADVRMFLVVADQEALGVNHFYPSFHMKKLEDGHMVSYFRP